MHNRIESMCCTSGPPTLTLPPKRGEGTSHVRMEIQSPYCRFGAKSLISLRNYQSVKSKPDNSELDQMMTVLGGGCYFSNVANG